VILDTLRTRRAALVTGLGLALHGWHDLRSAGATGSHDDDDDDDGGQCKADGHRCRHDHQCCSWACDHGYCAEEEKPCGGQCPSDCWCDGSQCVPDDPDDTVTTCYASEYNRLVAICTRTYGQRTPVRCQQFRKPAARRRCNRRNARRVVLMDQCAVAAEQSAYSVCTTAPA
jgi:hypothetical protein